MMTLLGGTCTCSQPLIRCGGQGCICTICGKPEGIDMPEDLGEEKVAEVNDRQVGGDHYRCDYQHWDFIERNGIGYLEASATKYVTRWRSKGGVGDLEKAVHYVEKLAELHKEGRRLPRGHAPLVDISRFADANKLTAIEKRIVRYLSQWCCESDLVVTLVALDVLIRQAKGEETS